MDQKKVDDAAAEITSFIEQQLKELTEEESLELFRQVLWFIHLWAITKPN